MIRIRLWLHGSLNDFLPPVRRNVAFDWAVAPRTSIKDAIESAGPPHPEIGRITANGADVDLSYLVQDGDCIVAYPFAEPIVLAGARQRFVLDTHLGTLARDLRLLGFDTWYRNDTDDETLAAISHDEERILLTRDIGLLKRSTVLLGSFVRATDPEQQTREIVRRYGLLPHIDPFSRCLRCNTPLMKVEKTEIEDRLPPRTRQAHTEFQRCPSCERIYWPGTHHERMVLRIEGLRAEG